MKLRMLTFDERRGPKEPAAGRGIIPGADRTGALPGAGGATAGRPVIMVEIVTGIGGFSSLREEWDRLTEESNASVFQSFDWLYAWWKHFGRGNDCRLHIMLIRDGARLVGIAPFFLQTISLRSRPLVRRLRMLGASMPRLAVGHELFSYYAPSDYLDIVAAAGWEPQVAGAVASHLNRGAGDLDEVELTNLPEDGVAFRSLLPGLDASVYRPVRHSAEQCLRRRVPPSGDEFLGSLGSGTRHKLQVARDTFTGNPLAGIEAVGSPAALRAGYRLLVRLHQKRWNDLGYPGVFSDSRFLTFQEEVADRFLRKGWLWLRIAMYNGEPVAARMAFRFRGRFYDYLAGFDPTLPGARRRPGLALLSAMVDDAIEEGIPVIDLLRGMEPYKLNLATEVMRVWSVTLRRRSSGGSCRRAVAGILMRRDRFRHLLHRELNMLKIQSRLRGAILSLPSYLLFLAKRCADRSRLVRGARPRSRITGGRMG